jgi:hypothetical protein
MIEGVCEAFTQDAIQSLFANWLKVLKLPDIDFRAHIGGLHLKDVVVGTLEEFWHIHSHLVVVILFLEAEIEVVLGC